jgi:hypothetical protein
MCGLLGDFNYLPLWLSKKNRLFLKIKDILLQEENNTGSGILNKEGMLWLAYKK